MLKKLILPGMLVGAIYLATPTREFESNASTSADRKDAEDKAMLLCLQRGAAYYKEIGSYPKLSTGEDARERVRAMCKRSKIAFGSD